MHLDLAGSRKFLHGRQCRTKWVNLLFRAPGCYNRCKLMVDRGRTCFAVGHPIFSYDEFQRFEMQLSEDPI